MKSLSGDIKNKGAEKDLKDGIQSSALLYVLSCMEFTK